MPNPVTHFEIIGKDAKKTQDFYRGLFGWKVDADNPMNYGMVEAQDGKGTGGGIGAGDNSGSSYVTIYVEVDNPQTYLDKAISMGGKLVMPVTTIPGAATFAQFTDPDGNLIGIVASEEPPH